MNEWTSTPQFEEQIKQSFAVPEIRAQFVDQVHSDLRSHARQKYRDSHKIFGLRPAWAVAMAVLTLMIITTLAIGPQQVYATVMRLFGYIPGVGIVDVNAPLRVLEEPVSVTRDGITVTVTSAVLSSEKTQIDYRIFGVPSSAYPDREDIAGCAEREFLRLDDGTRLTRIDNDYQPVPSTVNEAVLVIPCITNTLPGKAPENWELSLRFVPAAADMTVLPVLEELPSPEVTISSDLEERVVTVKRVIETLDGYILVGQFSPVSEGGESFQQTGAFTIIDASGKSVSYTYPLNLTAEIDQASAGVPGSGWAAEFKAADLVFPLTITFSGVTTYLDPLQPTAEFNFDASPNPQAGQVWSFNQELQIGDYNLKLVSIKADSRNGYSFIFQGDPRIASVAVEIVGHTANGGGGGSAQDGQFNASLSFARIPTGLLTVHLSNLTLFGEHVTWQGEWTPATQNAEFPFEPTGQPAVCLTPDSLTQLQPMPAGMINGRALFYEKLDNGEWGLVVYTLDGSQKQFVSNGNWGSLSPDGSQVAYSARDNTIHIYDLDTQMDSPLPGLGGFDLHWSPDGTRLAYVGMGNDAINSPYVIDIASQRIVPISEQSYVSILGWSPDGLLYFAVPYTGGVAWKVFRYDFTSEAATELFTIENGTPKLLNPKLSPDGQWIAYRGRDNSSVYLVRPDGSDMHLLLENVRAVGLVWSKNDWLGASLRISDSENYTAVLINPATCEVFQLPTVLDGDLEGLHIE